MKKIVLFIVALLGVVGLNAQNTNFGFDAGYSGNYNTNIGYMAGDTATGSGNTFVGYMVGAVNTSGGSNTMVGSNAGKANTTGLSNSFFGNNSGFSNTSGNMNCFFGDQAGRSNTTGSNNNFVGYGAGLSNTTGGTNNFFGRYSGQNNTTGNNNSFFGQASGNRNSTGINNNFFGSSSGLMNNNGNNNNFYGYASGQTNNSGSENVFFGNYSGYSNTSGSYNTLIGNYSGYSNITGNYNVFIGNRAGYSETGSNKLYIDNSNTTTPLIYGDFASDIVNINGKLGVGTVTPGSKLEVGVTHTGNQNEAIRIGSNSQNLFYGLGMNYRIDNDGSPSGHLVGYWANVSKDAISIALNTGNVGIGTTTPSAKLEVVGNGGITSFTGTTSLGLLVRGSNNGNDDLSGIDFTGYSADYNAKPLARIAVKPTSNGSYLLFGTSNGYTNGITNTAMAIDYNGNVGVGTTTPISKLDVRGDLYIDKGNDDSHIYWGSHNMTMGTKPGDYSHNVFTLKPGGASQGKLFSVLKMYSANSESSFEQKVQIHSDDVSYFNGGNVGIGTTNPMNKLDVNGTVHAREVKIDNNNWPDFVFKSNYKLRQLVEVENFIKVNGHLPEMPKAEDVHSNGVNVSDMQAKLLQKVEEMTLYIIEQNKQIKELQNRISELEKK
jgi:hypothetical protein